MVRAYVQPALEDVALWHERDISHSSVERMIGPDATVTLDFALNRLADLVEKLVVYPEAMQRNLDRQGGLVHSQRVMLALIEKGAAREGRLPAGAAKRHEGDRGRGNFRSLLEADPEVTSIAQQTEIEACFDLKYHLKHVDTIFKRVFGR
jgi:adenylosuccinate lyase